MSFLSILIPLVGLLLIYYAGMIGYDLYIAKLKKATIASNTESEIDISGELDGFAPIEVNRKEENASAPVATCGGMDIEKLRSLMESAANGKAFEGLDNISYKCLSVAS